MRAPETETSDRRLLAELLRLTVAFVGYALLVTIPVASFLVDEGWAADIANQLLKGRVLYRDVSAPYGPLLFELQALVLHVVGRSFFALRIVGLAVIVLQGVFLFLVGRAVIGRRPAVLLAPALHFLSLGLFQGTRLTASTLAGLFTVWSLHCHLRYLQAGGARHLLTAGLLLGLSFLTKHNVFAFDVAAHGLAMVAFAVEQRRSAQPLKVRDLVCLPLGILVVVVPYLASIHGWLDTFYRDTVGGIDGYARAMVAPVPKPWALLDRDLVEFTSALPFYSVFLLVLALACVLSRRTLGLLASAPVVLVFGVGILQLLQVFPVPDYSHLSRAMIVFPVLLVVVLRLGLDRRSLVAVAACGLAMLVHAGPMVFDQGQKIAESWRLPPSTLPCNALIRRDPQERELESVIEVVAKVKPKRLMVLGHGGAVRFLLDRENVTRETSVSPYFVAAEAVQAEVVADMVANAVDMVIVAPPLRPSTDIDRLPLIHDHLVRAWRPYVSRGGYRFLVPR